MSDGTEANTATNTTEATLSNGQTIPYARFAELVAEKNALANEKAALAAEVTTLKSANATAIQSHEARVKELESHAAEARMASALARIGVVDDEALDLARFKFDSLKLPEGVQKPDFGTFIAEQKTSGAKWLKSYLPESAAVSTNAPTVTVTTPTPTLQPVTTSADKPGASATMDLDRMMADTSPRAWRGIREQALKLGGVKPA